MRNIYKCPFCEHTDTVFFRMKKHIIYKHGEDWRQSLKTPAESPDKE